MEDKKQWVRATYYFYKFIDINIINAFICIIIGMLVNTFTAGTINAGYTLAILLFILVIFLAILLILYQGNLKRMIDQTVVKNQNMPAAERFTSLEDIEIYAIEFDEKKSRRILRTVYWIPPIMILSLVAFRYGYKKGDPEKDRQILTQQAEIDSIRNTCKAEQTQLLELRTLVQKLQPLQNHISLVKPDKHTVQKILKH